MGCGASDKMRRKLTLIAVLALFLLGSKYQDFMVLTVINKSGMGIAISLVAQDLSRAYYITIPEGDREHPYEMKFTVVKDPYRMRVFWLEDKDPKTGMRCQRVRGSTLVAHRNVRVVVAECDRLPPNAGEPTMVKFGRVRCIE
jgi:hypothetical protein